MCIFMKSMSEIIDDIKKELKIYKVISIVSIILNCILTMFVIGSYVLPWGYF